MFVFIEIFFFVFIYPDILDFYSNNIILKNVLHIKYFKDQGGCRERNTLSLFER